MAWRSILRPFGQPPGSWLLAASLFGWIMLASRAAGPDMIDQTMALCSSGRLLSPESGRNVVGHSSHAADWLAMVLAMAPLLLRNEVAALWRSNLPRLRWLAIAAFVCGYGLVWALLGAASLRLAVAGADLGTVSAVACATLVWHCSPLRQRCLNACHAVPKLRAFGTAMPVDAGRYGLRSGVYCCAICGPAMLLVMNLSVNHAVLMTLLTPVLMIERYLPARTTAWRFPLLNGRPRPAWMTLASPPSSNVPQS